MDSLRCSALRRLCYSRARLRVAVLLCGILSGCAGRPPAVPAPSYNPEESARLAMQAYDKNHDGKLDEQELEACPALLGSLKEIDKNEDGAIQEEEIADRIRYYQQLGTGRMMVRCRVDKDGQACAGITVKLIPEEFMAGSVGSAQGTSDEVGHVPFADVDSNVAGAPCGFYKVEVTQDGARARLESDSPKGYEVAPAVRGQRQGLVILVAP